MSTSEPKQQGPAVFVQRGGYRIGAHEWVAINWTWPFGKIEVRPGELTLHCITRALVFPAAAITELSTHSGFWSVGLRIEHGVRQYPSFVVFWTVDMDELKAGLACGGFIVAE